MNDYHSYSTPPRRLSSRFTPSERFSDRKRALFPTSNKENDSDSDLGHMSPLELSSSPERYDSPLNSPHISDIFKEFNHRPFSNINKFGNMFENVTPLKKKDPGSPILLVPSTPSPTDSPKDKGNTNIVIPETPTKISPTQALKTPHESSSANLQLPRLVRKSLGDLSNVDKSGLKRKQDDTDESPCNKSFKLDTTQNKISKARTSLFPENILPAKSFYPKSIEEYKPSSYVFSEPLYQKRKSNRKQSRMYLCSRKKMNKSFCGQINAGVRHGIRKPKHKSKLNKTQLLKAAIDLIENSPLNAYLENKENIITNDDDNTKENTLSKDQLNAMDSLLKNISTDAFKPQPLTVLTTQPPPIENNRTPSTKRSLSPEPHNDSSNKKFFKNSRTNATFTLQKNIKLSIDNDGMHLLENKQRKNKRNNNYYSEITFDTSDLIFDSEKLPDTNVGDILKSLEDDNVIESTTSTEKIVLTAHSSVSASDNSIQLHEEPTTKKITPTEMLLSPTTLMCDMTSGLAINSPKNQQIQNDQDAIDITKKCISFSEMTDEKQKLYPIFYANNNNNASNTAPKESQTVQNLRKIWKPLSDDQMLIDAGQKKFGHTQCSECGLVYHIGDPDDEIIHHNYHHSTNVLKFNVSSYFLS